MTAPAITARGVLHGHTVEVRLHDDGRLEGNAVACSLAQAMVRHREPVGIAGVWTGEATLEGSAAAIMATLRAIFEPGTVEVEGLVVPDAQTPEHSIA